MGEKIPRHLENFSKIFKKNISLGYRFLALLDRLERQEEKFCPEFSGGLMYSAHVCVYAYYMHIICVKALVHIYVHTLCVDIMVNLI